MLSEGSCSLSQCAASEDRHHCQPHTGSVVPASAVPAATQGQKDLQEGRRQSALTFGLIRTRAWTATWLQLQGADV